MRKLYIGGKILVHFLILFSFKGEKEACLFEGLTASVDSFCNCLLGFLSVWEIILTALSFQHSESKCSSPLAKKGSVLILCDIWAESGKSRVGNEGVSWVCQLIIDIPRPSWVERKSSDSRKSSLTGYFKS